MLAALRNFFDQHIANRAEESEATAERRAQIAAAALLIEVARSDQSFSDEERQAVLESVQRKFNLGTSEARELLRLAETESREAHDIFQFTSKIDASFTPERKTQLIEELWRAAYSDGKLHEYEEHLIRRVCDLLHISHSGFIAAKLRVLASREQGSGS